MMFSLRKKTEIPTAAEALPGRAATIPTAETHFVNGRPLAGPYPEGARKAVFGLGCFWGAEKLFWRTPGVTNTAVGYQGGFTPNPTYEEACSGRTGHTETVKVCFDPATISYADLVTLFFENHDPTQGMRQGNDIGTQYRSAIFCVDADAAPFHYAEAYHQQYLDKNPGGYCPIHATGVKCSPGE